MFCKKTLNTNLFLTLTISFSLMHATIIDVEIMRLGQDIIILNKDQHHFDDSQEIWQAAALLASTNNPQNPADLILIEKNDIANQWDSLPNPFNSDRAALDLHEKWVTTLTSVLQNLNLYSLDGLKIQIKAEYPSHGNELSLLNLFYDTYIKLVKADQIPNVLSSADHRRASALIWACTSDYSELFRNDVAQWQEQKQLPDILSDCKTIIKDLARLPSITLFDLYHEQNFILQIKKTLKKMCPDNTELAQKLDSKNNDNRKEVNNLFRSFVYLYDFNLFQNTSLDDFKSLFKKDDFFTPEESAAFQKICPLTIQDVLREGINCQTQYLYEQLNLRQTRAQNKTIQLFLQKRHLLFAMLSIQSLLCTAQMFELEAFIQILELVHAPHTKSQKIVVLGGIEHLEELAEMLELIGAETVQPSNILEATLEVSPETAEEAFNLCNPINNILEHLL